LSELVTPTVPVSSLLNNLEDPIESVEKEIFNSLSHLERIGVLQPRNRMDLTELLNPVNEDDMYDNGTEEEIKQAVLERRAAEQGREKNAGDGDDLDEVVEVKPSRREALAAASTLSKYVADIDEPFARKLEVISWALVVRPA